MYHYLFTNDLRISSLDDSLKKAGQCFIDDTVPSSAEDKSQNNNMMTLGFYFNLANKGKCAEEAAAGNSRAVVLNFIKKFQFPNLRTTKGYEDSKNDGIKLAPMRVIVKLLYTMNILYGSSIAYLTKEEIKYFVFFNENIAKRKSPNIGAAITSILEYRKTGKYPNEIDTDDSHHEWKHEDRQLREMLKVLQWSGCITEVDEKYVIDNDKLSTENKAAVYDIISYDEFWEGESIESYRKYMELSEADIIDNDEKISSIPVDLVDADEQRRRFKSWLGLQKKSNGDSYSPNTITSYIGQMELVYKNFAQYHDYESVFEIQVKDELSEYTSYLFNEPGFDEFNDIAGNKACSNGFIKYGEFLASGDNISDIYNHDLYGIHMKLKNDGLSEENPHICIGWSVLGDLSLVVAKEELALIYDQHIDKNSKGKGQDVGQIWRFKDEVKTGDYVLYADGQYCHIGRVDSDYYYDTEDRSTQDTDYRSSRKVTWLKKNIDRNELSGALHRSLGTAMSIWRMNDYKAAVAALLDGTYVKDEEDVEVEVKDKLTCLDIKRMPRTDQKHPINFIIYGAPGTGKTYSTAEYAMAIIENRDADLKAKTDSERAALMDSYKQKVKDGQIVFTTFHQSYGYEEFIQGLRPDTSSGTMSFKTVDGTFKKIADRAMLDDEENYVIIIDEINRANISKVFGELITLIEEDKRWGELNEMSAVLPSGEPFAVPNNLYIVGTMNSADKSISLIDVALRRRFEFVEQKPDAGLIENDTLKGVLTALNGRLADDLGSTDLLIGHSYFIGKKEEDLPRILNNSIIPLLYEYYYDNSKKVKKTLEAVLKDMEVKVNDSSNGRLSVE